MTNQIWINLPVKNVQNSVDFYTKLGFEFNTQHSVKNQSACMQVGVKKILVMLFKENMFKVFSNSNLINAPNTSEVLFSIDAESKNEVNEFAKKVDAAGGKIFSPPKENQGWMYGFGFCDLDNHRWNMLYMDTEKMEK